MTDHAVNMVTEGFGGIKTGEGGDVPVPVPERRNVTNAEYITPLTFGHDNWTKHIPEPTVKDLGLGFDPNKAAILNVFKSGVNQGMDHGLSCAVEKEAKHEIFIQEFGQNFHIIQPKPHIGTMVFKDHFDNLEKAFVSYLQNVKPAQQRRAIFAFESNYFTVHKASASPIFGAILLVRAEEFVGATGFMKMKSGDFAAGFTLVEMHCSPIKSDSKTAKDFAGTFGECADVEIVQIINGAYSEQLGSDYSEPVKPVWGGEDVGGLQGFSNKTRTIKEENEGEDDYYSDPEPLDLA